MATKSFTVSTPNWRNLRKKRESFHGGKFFAVIALGLLAVYAGYQGWVTVPSADTIGGLLGIGALLVVIGLLVLAVNTERKWLRAAALVVAFVLGIISAQAWKGLGEFFSSLSLSELLGFGLGVTVLVAVAAWCAHHPPYLVEDDEVVDGKVVN